MDNYIPVDKGFTAYVTGRSKSPSLKQVIAQVLDYKEASKTFYLYGQGESPLAPPEGDPPIKIFGQLERGVIVSVKTNDELSTLVKSTCAKDPNNPDNTFIFLFESDSSDPPNITDALVVIYLVQNK